MGSFASTCCVSGLPIEAGDPVRWFLLTQNPYTGKFVHTLQGRWVPRTWPIKAVYNDYGSIEGWEEGPLQEAVMKGLQADLVEVGVGDNPCYDMAARRDMTFAQLLDAVWEGRVSVREIHQDHPEWAVEEAWRPSLKRVERVLDALPGYLVDEVGGWVRVRWDAHADCMERLAEAKALLERHFAVVLTAGSGNYADSAELRCFPAPGDDHYDYTGPDRAKPLLVQQAMIREDVWQQLLTLRIPTWDGPPRTVGSFRRDAHAMFEEAAKWAAVEPRSMFWRGMRGRPSGIPQITQEAVPGVVGLHAHADALLRGGAITADIIDVMAEFAFLHEILFEVRYVFRPSDTTGPQDGADEAHTRFLRALTRVSRASGGNNGSR